MQNLLLNVSTMLRSQKSAGNYYTHVSRIHNVWEIDLMHMRR